MLCAGSIERRRIRDALSYWEELTCVSFAENSRALFKLVFVKQSGQVMPQLHRLLSSSHGSIAEWLACWTQAQKGPGSNRSRDAVG